MAIGVDRMHRNFKPLKQQVEQWQAMQLSTAAAKLLIYPERQTEHDHRVDPQNAFSPDLSAFRSHCCKPGRIAKG